MMRRWRLFPKYALLIIALAAGMVLASGAVAIYFAHRESRDHLVALQDEKAQGAAARIEQYVQGIEHQLSWTTLPRIGTDGSGNDALETRRIEYLKLLRQVPAITEVVWIDPRGREQLRVSRLAMDTRDSGADFSREPTFVEASASKTYYGPVYFRKGTEPYLTIARPAGSGGGVTAAEVNLKFVWEVVSRIRIGERGLAYVVEPGGTLIAHPDISLVLKKTDLRTLPQVTALASPAGPPDDARDLQGEPVLSAHARIPTLGWTVFVESPRAEAYAPLYDTLQRMGLVLVVGLLVATAASYLLARALVRPLRALQEGAAQIGEGDLDRRIEVGTGDELEGLAEQFNRMGAALKASYAGLERKIEARTAELSEALERQTATAQILRVISASPTRVQPVLDAVAERSGLLCHAQGSRLWLAVDGELRAMTSYGPAYGNPEAWYPTLPLRITSPAGRALIERRAVLVDDVKPLIDTEYPDIRELQARHGFRTVLAVPLLREGEAIGIIGLLRNEVRPFTQAEINLVQTFADQAVIAIENVRLFIETKEALERQTATAEILRVISGSPTSTEPVFDAILASGARLCEADMGLVLRYESGVFQTVATLVPDPGFDAFLRQPIKAGPATGLGRVARTKAPVHIPDLVDDEAYRAGDPLRVRSVELGGVRTWLGVPMLREGELIGALAIYRKEVRPFARHQIDVLTTFADQAVIAIENVRLFNETREALEQQTATAEILQVISRSPTDVQPVFDAIAERALTLCEATVSGVARYDGELVHLVAFHGASPEASAAMLAAFPIPAGRGAITARAIAERAPVQIADVLNDPDYELKEATRLAGYRSNLAVPMLREGQVIGSIGVCRTEPGVFPEKQVKLLQTFADQAVIAIENVRLFSETREALQRQTATAEILQVISSSVSDAQPVFNTILASCERLFGGHHMGITLVGADGQIHLAAHRGPASDAQAFERAFPVPLTHESGSGAAILDACVMHYPDTEAAEVPLYVQRSSRAIATRSVIIAPLLWQGRGIGAIFVGRGSAGPFSDKDIALLRTFADQAVIAIQNARLFNETKDALEQQTATSDVLKTISRTTFDLEPVLTTLIESASRLCKADKGFVYLREGSVYEMKAGYRFEPGGIELPTLPAESGSLVGRTALTREIVHIEDARNDPGYTWKESQERLGYRTMLGVPMLREGEPIGVIGMWRDEVRPFSERDIRIVTTFADQAVIALENARLLSEIQAKSRELEAANRHKSEFLANMSHELRTPLNAIIGFSEVLLEQMFGDVNDKQLEYLHDIHSSGQHLLTLINDVLDLSKIEAGRMELDLSCFDLGLLLDNSLTLVRERAQRHGLSLTLQVDEGLEEWVADARKVKQVVVNLLSNAVKFTPTGGSVSLRARRVETGDRVSAQISVADTGVGIAIDEQALVFEEFRQASGDYLRKTEGTGLGLTLARRFVELHGGTIALDSRPGAGATFTVTLPLQTLEAIA